MIYNYFISYRFQIKDGDCGDGNCSYNISHKISSFKDILELQESIKKQRNADIKISTVLINNFILIDVIKEV